MNNKKGMPAGATVVNDAVNEIATMGKSETGLTMKQAWDIAENTPVEVMTELSSEYFKEWKKGVEMTFLVKGFTTAELKGQKVECVTFETRDGRKLINGDKTFVSGVKRLDVALPAFVKAIYEKDIEGDKGEYKDIRVFAMPK